jgi:cysteine synthase A
MDAASPARLTGIYRYPVKGLTPEQLSRAELKPGQTVVEYTGGSTGTSLALVCALKGYPLRIVTSDAFAAEKLATMRAFGAG